MSLRQREPRVRDKEHLGRVAKLPCIACLVRGFRKHGVHVAHVRASYPEPDWRPVGAGEKPSDHRTLPLCPDHHLNGPEAQHRNPFPGGERGWWAHFGIYPPEVCHALVEAFACGQPGDKVLQRFAEVGRRTLRP